MNICLQCNNKTDNPKFCSLSCSGKYQKGRRSNLVDRNKLCATCGVEFVAKADRKQKFCSRSCSATFSNKYSPKRLEIYKSRKKFCLWCSEDIIGHGKTYCSLGCKTRYYQKKAVEEWLNNPEKAQTGYSLKKPIRDYLISQAENRCSSCGWNEINPVTRRTPLEIDHINGDSNDNRIENLRVLCPNCHSLTPTYRALNKKSSRVARSKYYNPKR